MTDGYGLVVDIVDCPETMTVCAVSQLPLVNVRLEGLSVAAPVSPLDGVTVTVPLGSVVSTTV